MKKLIACLMLILALVVSLSFGVFGAEVSVNEAYDAWADAYIHWDSFLITFGNAYNRYTYIESPYALAWGMAFPDDPIIYNGYLPKSSLALDITVVDVTYMDSMLYLYLDKAVTWKKGYEYTFYVRFSGYGLTQSGMRIETIFSYVDVFSDGPQGEYVSTKTVSTVEGYEDYYKIVFTPPDDMIVSSFLFAISDLQTIWDFADDPVTLNIDLVLSSVVMSAVDDELAFSEVNPQLSQIQGTLDDINDAIHNNPYGELTASPDNNPGELVGEDAKIEEAGAVLDKVDLVIDGIPSGATSFWNTVLEEMFSWSIFLPFILVGVGFILTRALIGR